MSTVAERRKALRGTKRACQACEVRFYDLGRDPIVCPTCGSPYAPAAQPIVAARAAPFAGKTGWRNRPFKRPDDRVAHPEVSSQVGRVEEPADDTASPAAEEDGVLDQEQDDAEAPELTDLDSPEENP
jgi:uncharacterized protein (TIGR02300 family)